MTILCCYVNDIRPETKASLALASDVEMVDTSDHEYSYWHEVRSRWNTVENLVIVEQDIAFTKEDLESFDTCAQPWCLFGYDHYYGRPETYLTEGLGFARFRKELMASVPVDQITCQHDGEISWINLDSRIKHSSWRYGFRPHVHGTVDHYHMPE